MKLLQINSALNTGSTGHIVEDIGNAVIHSGGSSYVGYGRRMTSSASHAVKIGNKLDQAVHLVQTRLFDNHGLASKRATHLFIREIRKIQPDIIHLHNLHGYYINFEVLFDFLKHFKKPVVWTFHDCWPFTGHCAHFDHIKCNKWEVECCSCPMTSRYPASYGLDRSTRNYRRKRVLFNSIDSLTIVAVSGWLKDLVDRSFFKDKKSLVIYNGVDMNIFRPLESDVKKKYGLENRKFVLGVSNIWTGRKGLNDFLELRKILDSEIAIVLVGLSKTQIKQLPSGIIGIPRTESLQELAEIYSAADVFVNPSILETFGLVTAEAMACGTPVVVYNATASPELVYQGTGKVVEKGNVSQLAKAVMEIISIGKKGYSESCRETAAKYFDKNERCFDYLKLYSVLTGIEL